MHKNVIIVAGGKGLRMGNELPKQFIEIAKKPILMHTIEAFYNYDNAINIVIVLPTEHQQYWESLCEKHNFQLHHNIINGGETRFQSVLNGLNTIENNGLTAVHDGVRPFVSHKTIQGAFEMANLHGAAIPVVAPVESIREIKNETNIARNRELYRLVQTPQVFKTSIIKQAYKQDYNLLFTDDASVVEAKGYKIALVEGNRENIKITSPFDLIIANAILK
jgi:2-C-methyl-D-erythritol 4-phosphate cytidylyltransferase